MRPNPTGFVLLLCCLLVACRQPGGLDPNAWRESDGKLIVYLQPLKQGADHLRFHLAEISAIQVDGPPIPLTVTRPVLDGEQMKSQRLIAVGAAPAGTYRGLTLRFERAELRGEEGFAALHVPQEATEILKGFKTTQRKTTPLFLTFVPTGSVQGEALFRPGFQIAGPDPVIPGLIGFVTSPQTDSVTVFNKRSMQVVDVLTLGRGPAGIAVDPVRQVAYIALSEESAVAVVDTRQWGGIPETLSLNFQDRPTALALTPDGRTLVCANQGSNTVSLIDTAVLSEIIRLQMTTGPAAVVMGPLGRRAFVMNADANAVTVVDLTQQRQAATIAFNCSPVGGAFTPQGDRLFVISPDSSDLITLNPGSLLVEDHLFVGPNARAIQVDPHTGMILIGGWGRERIDLFDPFARMGVAALDLGGSVVDMSLDAEEYSLFVALEDPPRVLKIELGSHRVSAAIEIDAPPFAVAVVDVR